ncbi:MAG: sulfotransferase [Promethearchaeota archaeon]
MWDKLKDNRIFVGGHRKNGTTVLIALLDGHPDLFIYPYETHFWYSFYPIYAEGNFSVKEKVERITQFLFEDLKEIIQKWLKLDENGLNFSYQELNAKYNEFILKNGNTTKDFFDTMCYLVRELLPCPNYQTHKSIVTKDTMSEIHVNELFKLYPKSTFIHIMRDPRDNCAVIMNGWDKHYKRNYDSKERLFRDAIDRGWLSMRMAIDNQKIYGDEKYLIIKYEDLILNTKATMRKVSKFIGIDFNRLNFDTTFCGIPWEGNSFTNMKYKGVNTSRIGMYRKYLTEDQIKVLEYYFEGEMIHFGYKPDYKRSESVDAVREHYKWFNNNQIYSGKAFRKY